MTIDNLSSYLWHVNLLNGADHVCGFLAPVTLDHIALYGCAVDRNNSVSCCFVGVEPAGGRERKKLALIIKSYIHGIMNVCRPIRKVLSPHKGVAFVWENTDFHYLAERREGLSHSLLCEEKKMV